MWQYKYHKDVHGIVANYIKANNIKCKFYGFMCKSGNYCWSKIDGKDVFFNMNTHTQVDYDTFMQETANDVYNAELKYKNHFEYLFYS